MNLIKRILDLICRKTLLVKPVVSKRFKIKWELNKEYGIGSGEEFIIAKNEKEAKELFLLYRNGYDFEYCLNVC